MSLVRTLDRPFIIFLMTENVNLSISQSAASELSRQASFGGSPGEMFIDLVEDKNCSDGWIHIKLRPGSSNGSPISRTEGVTLYADVKRFNSVSYTHLTLPTKRIV